MGSIGASYARNPRNPSSSRRPRSVVELCAGIRGGERSKRRADERTRRFYHPVEFIKKIRCSRRQHLIRYQRREILLDSFPLTRNSSSSSVFHDLSPNDRPSTSRLSHFTPFVQPIRRREAKARVFLARVILAIFARGRAAVLFERAVSSTRKKNRRITLDREREGGNTHAHKVENEAIFRPVRFARSNRVPALSATENSVQTQFRSFLYSDSGNAPLESASEAGPIYRLTVTRTRG